MPQPGRTRRLLRRTSLRLRATSPLERPAHADAVPDPVMGWIPAAVGGGVVAAVASWIIVAGLTVIGWLPGTSGSLPAALGLATQMWLLAHGASVTISGAVWTLPPLGITLIAVAAVRGVAAFAGRQALLARAETDPQWGARATQMGRVALVVAAVYIVVLAAANLITGHEATGRFLVGLVLIAVSAAVMGAVQGTDLDVVGLLPQWARSLPRAIMAAQLVLVCGGAAALIASMIVHRDRMIDLTEQLGGGPSAAIALTALQVAFLPTVVVWSVAWVLGPGFRVGIATVVSPANTQLGLLPAIPISGALPAEGPGEPMMLLWLLVGVAAGAMAAAMVMRARPAARCDETALVGGLAGACSGLLAAALSLCATGNLGANRLTGLGPRALEMVVVAPALLGLSGMAVGLVWGLVRTRVRPRGTVESDAGAR